MVFEARMVAHVYSQTTQEVKEGEGIRKAHSYLGTE